MRNFYLLFALVLFSTVVMAQEVVPSAITPTLPAGTEYTPQQLPLKYEAGISNPGRTNYPPVVPATSPLRRVAPADSRMTCDDYSTTYFAKHPAMAAVCGISQPEAEAPAVQPAEVSPTHL